VDSISFTLQPLKGFPSTFGLTELAKGYFPHKFNTPENQNYIGSYPDKEFYGYSTMKKKEKEEFNKWFATTNNTIFNFKEEMYKYCKSDVDILRRGCLVLRDLFLKTSNIDPFQYVTIASVCNAIYRNEFIPKDTIAVVKETPSDNYSVKAIKWLKYLSISLGIDIKHALNGGEASININGRKIKVDGINDKTIYQFHGCYYHGCKKCYKDLDVNKVSNKYMKCLREETERKDKQIKDAGYKLVTMCEC